MGRGSDEVLVKRQFSWEVGLAPERSLLPSRSTAAHTDMEQTKRFLDQMIKSPYNGVSDFVICLPDPENTGISSDGSDETAIPIGKAGLWNGTEIGFILAREFWGKGYAFEALDAIVKQFWATNDKGDARIKADVDPRNKRCLRLLKKLGFVEIGRAKDTYETHIGWCDSVYLEARKPSSI